MDRRDFLRTGIVLGGAAALGACVPKVPGPPLPTKHQTILGGAPGDSGIDTVVIVMMENRSFDAYLGYLADDPAYIARGRKLYGKAFTVNGQVDQAFPDLAGDLVPTRRRTTSNDAPDPWRGCGLEDPGHSWTAGRAERDQGFLAEASGNDELALSYFTGDDLPFYRNLAGRFSVCDRAHASLLGPTFPNRAYFLSGQSGGIKNNALPIATGGYPWPSIVEKLVADGVTVTDYSTDLPSFALWGARLGPYITPVAKYFVDAPAGLLPQISFVEPSYAGDFRTDDHPHGDPRAAQAFVRDAFRAFVRSPQWERGLFILTYDEWGGFFDHVPPPILPDDRASSVDEDNFGQAGFRVPVFLCSPRSLPNYVDHRQYDHTSILRFLEWRFLGAPPEGPNALSSTPWWLTTRDRNANNIGRSLCADVFDPDPGFDVDLDVGTPAPPSAPEVAGLTGPTRSLTPFEELYETGYFERVGIPVPL